MKLASDLRFSLRQLLQRPGFSLAAIGTLALGIAAAIAMFSITQAVVFKPLPYDQAERAVMIWSSWKDFPQTWVSYDEYEAYREEISAFDSVGIAYAPMSLTVGGAEDPELVQGSAISIDTLKALGVQPSIGREFLPAEDTPGGAAVALIGFDLWQRRYHADPDIVGGTVDINGSERRIVGVLPTDFRMPFDYGSASRTEVLIPLAADPADWEAVAGPGFRHAGGAHTFHAFARLDAGASTEAANAQLLALTRRLNADGVYPEGWDFRARAVPLPQQVSGELQPALWLLGAGVALLLAIACANVAGLMLIRGEYRRREFGIRMALGAGPTRLAQQLLIESLSLSVCAGLLGFALGGVAVQAIRALAPANLPRMDELAIDGSAFAMALSLAFLTALAASFGPALQVMRRDPARAVHADGGNPRSGSSLRGGRGLLVAGEIALAVLLTVGAGLMIRTVDGLLDVDPGFDAREVATLRISVPSSRYPEDAQVHDFYRELHRRLSALPGVEVAGAVRLLPLDSEIGDMGIHVDGYLPPPGQPAAAEWQVVLPGYFEALGVRLVDGRFLDERDPQGEPAVIVNRQFAERYLAGADPVGREVVLGGRLTARIVGIVEDTRHNGLLSDIKPRFYIHHAFVPQRTMNLVVRLASDAGVVAADIRRELHALDPRLAASEIRHLADIVDDVTAQPRFVMLILSAFAVVALALGAVGVYATLAYFVSRSVREIGIRMSLGAQRRRIFLGVMGRGMALILAGAAIGVGAAVTFSRFLESMLVGVTPLDALTYASTLVLFVAGGAAACALPAFRATGIHPAVALRQE